MTTTTETERPPETIHVPAGRGERLAVMGTVLTLKIVGADTGGAYSLWEASVPPGGGPPPHTHHREEETTYVLEGEFEFVLPGGTLLRAGPGECVRTPRGVPHGFSNVGQGSGRLLVVAAPAGVEQFFAAVGQRLQPGEAPRPSSGPPTPEQRAHLAQTGSAYGMEFVGRPAPQP